MHNPTHRPHNIVGPRTRALRSRLGWSQMQLAVRCQLLGWDIDRCTIARIEAGTRWVGDFELLLLARVLQVSAVDLLSNDCGK